MILTNLAGLWALLGIPLVLAIHFLQRKARSVPVSTLFLLEQTQRESLSGRRFDRLTSSIPLWLQLLFVLLLTWLLVEPRYGRADSVQRVAIVLDSSASMQAFRPRLLETLRERLPTLRGAAAQVEFLVTESHPERPRIYAGNSLDALLAALDKWSPDAGTLDPTPALRIARSLVAREGLLIYATDTPLDPLPFEAQLLAVGTPLENVGFTGVSFAEEQGALVWKALIRNHSTTPQQRGWRLVMADGTSTEPTTTTLQPGQLAQLQGAFPTGAERCTVMLSGDGFPVDDVLPLVRPAPKPLLTRVAPNEKFAELFERLAGSLVGARPAEPAGQADLVLTAYDPLAPALPDGHAIVMMDDQTRGGQYLRGGIISEQHPLITGLNWQPLLVRETIRIEKLPSDQVLLWQGEVPLILLRGNPSNQQLIFNFDVSLSNAARLPAFVVLIHRFAERVLQAKVATHAETYEAGQPLDLAYQTSPGAPPLVMEFQPVDGKPTRTELPASQLARHSAPRTPGHFTIRQGELELIRGATFFADPREADFSATTTTDTLDPRAGAAIDRQTRQDHFWRLWILAAIACLLAAWHFTHKPTAATAAA